jgi:prevent-host-death family protein
MTISTFSSREFNQDISRAKRAASDGPVFITDRGKPAHVLMTIEQYKRLTGGKRNIVEALSMPGLSGADVSFPRAADDARPADLS